jgi:phosphatidylglycerophosphate synthase
MKSKDFTYLSEVDKPIIHRIRNLRTKLFAPISSLLIKIGCSPHQLSLFGFFILSGFVYFVPRNRLYALGFLLGHVIIDGMDGALARLQKTDGNEGAFSDIVIDLSAMVVFIITLIFYGILIPWIAAMYIYIYTIMIIFLLVRNICNIPVTYVVHSKYMMYGLFAVLVFWKVNFLNLGLVIFTLLMAPVVITSYLKIKNHLGQSTVHPRKKRLY